MKVIIFDQEKALVFHSVFKNLLSKMKIDFSDITISRIIIAVAGFLTVLLSIIVSLKQDTLIGILFMTTTNLGKTEN